MNPLFDLDARVDLLKQCLTEETDFDAVLTLWHSLRALEGSVGRLTSLAGDKAHAMRQGRFTERTRV